MKWSFVPNTKGRFSVSCTGKVNKNATNEILTTKKSHEYDVVNIEGVRWYVHVLVLTVFVGPRPKGKKALHRNDDTGNNEVGNLYWGTQSQNMHDAYRNGGRTRRKQSLIIKKQHQTGKRICTGEHNANAKLTNRQVLEIRRACSTKKYGVQTRMAKKYGVSLITVQRIANTQYRKTA